jgi:hypothetical protein
MAAMEDRSDAYVRYRDEVEVRRPDEERVTAEIVDAMRRIAEPGLDHYRHAVRPSHAKSHGLLKGELRVLDGLPEPLRQGLFAQPRTYPVVVRLSLVPGDLVADGVTTQRGMSIKVIGVEGAAAMLPGHEGEVTQDFLLDNFPSFPVADAPAFLATIRALEPTTDRLEPLKQVVSAASRGANAVLKSVGLESAKLGFFGHPPKHPLADSYHSQAPLRYGDHVAKLAAVPVGASLEALKDVTVDVGAEFSALREAVVGFMKEHSAEYELRVQLCTDLKTMPVEDASVAWPEEASPYRPVARITLPPQDAYSPAWRVHVDEVLAFSPAHGLAAHRPLGSLMRARLKAYEPSARFRHAMNVRPCGEPRSIDEIPD